MNVLLRLLRISLLLRIVPALFATIAVTVNFGDLSVWLVTVVVLPALVILGLSFWLERRGQIKPRTVRWLLIWALFLQVLEFVVTSTTFLLAVSRNQLSAEVMGRIRSEQGGSDLGGTFLLTLVPVVLGAWLDGRRGVLRWVAAATLLSVIGLMVVATLDTQLGTHLYSWRSQVGNATAYMIVMAVVCYFVGSLADQQRTEHAQLELAHTRLAEQAHVREVLATNQERMRLSRDLHDTVAHTLAALSVQLNVVGAVLPGEQVAARAELGKARGLVKEGLENTRRAISDLRANQVIDFGLEGALQKLAEAFTQRTDVAVLTHYEGNTQALSPEVANTLYRIAQEALNNVERHAHASEVRLQLQTRLEHEHTRVTLSVSDNGQGFTQSPLDDEQFGLKGMRERADLIGAHLRLDSAPGAGTTVTLQMLDR